MVCKKCEVWGEMSNCRECGVERSRPAHEKVNVIDAKDIEYLTVRLERVLELLREGNIHMATAKLMADITALKAAVQCL